MSAITTHVLDISIGMPAIGVPVRLERKASNGEWESIGSEQTDNDGRVRGLIANDESLVAGVYRLIFDVHAYFEPRQTPAFYPEVTIEFVVYDASQHYHVPLLLSPFGYSTYRGS